MATNCIPPHHIEQREVCGVFNTPVLNMRVKSDMELLIPRTYDPNEIAQTTGEIQVVKTVDGDGTKNYTLRLRMIWSVTNTNDAQWDIDTKVEKGVSLKKLKELNPNAFDKGLVFLGYSLEYTELHNILLSECMENKITPVFQLIPSR